MGIAGPTLFETLASQTSIQADQSVLSCRLLGYPWT